MKRSVSEDDIIHVAYDDERNYVRDHIEDEVSTTEENNEETLNDYKSTFEKCLNL
jgi:hypothetical protein